MPGWSQIVRLKTPQRGVWFKATFPAGTPAHTISGSRQMDNGKTQDRQVISPDDIAFMEIWIRGCAYDLAKTHGFLAAYQRSMSNSNLKAGGPGYPDEMIAEAEAIDRETRHTRWLYQAAK